jgi:hypothetical protein
MLRRHRQLPVRTLFPGMLLALADDRPAQLTRVHQALISLPQADQVLAVTLFDHESAAFGVHDSGRFR